MRNAKEKTRILPFRLERERLISLALEKQEEGELSEAMSLLRECMRLYGVKEDVLGLLATAYEDAELFQKAINSWFFYLDCFGEKSSDTEEEIYEGLAVNYMNLGREMESFLYYKKMMDLATQNPSADGFERMMELPDFTKKKEEPKLKLLPPLNEEDKETDEKTVNQALKSMQQGDIDGAIRALKGVKNQSPAYQGAVNLLAVCYALKGNFSKGIAACKAALKSDPNDVQTLATLSALYAENGERDKSLSIAKDLCSREISDVNLLLKIGTVACENGLDEEAVKLFTRVSAEMPFEKTVLYLLAVGEFHLDHLAKSRLYFHKLLSVYPEAFVAKRQLDRLLDYEEERKKNPLCEKPEMGYAYRLPEGERKSVFTFLKKSKRADAENEETREELKEALKTCFDEFDGQDFELQHFAMSSAIRLGIDDFTREELLRSDVSDLVKFGALYDLVVRNTPFHGGVVLSNLYFKFKIPKIHLGQKMRKLFLSAAGEVTARCVAFDQHAAILVASATEEIYRYAVVEQKREEVDPAALRCAIYLSSGAGKERTGVNEAVMDYKTNILKVSALLPPMHEEEVAISEADIEKLFEKFTEDNTDETH